jgi:hypothetical protein
MAIDNIFVDISKYKNYFVSSLHNGLSDHEGQLLTIVLPLTLTKEHQIYSYRKINNFTVADFQNQLSYEKWDNIFDVNDVNFIIISFLNTCLTIFNSSVLILKKHTPLKKFNINWITPGIRTSFKHKKNLYLMMKNNNNLSIKVYYNSYCKILNKVTIAVKKMAYDNCINKSYNKLNTTWKIINIETGRTLKPNDSQHLTEKFNGKNVAELINDSIINHSWIFLLCLIKHHTIMNMGMEV